MIINRKEAYIWAMIGLILGIGFFLLLAGYKILNPFYYDWILAQSGDCSISLLGWLFYNKTPWSESLFGSFDSTYPHELSIIFTDCIIPFAILTKVLFGAFIEEGQIVQYLGIWGAFCYAMQGLFSGLIAFKLMRSQVMRIGGIVLFITSPVIMQRLFAHNTLIAHWLLLVGICLFLFRNELGKKRWVIGIFLVMFGTSIHMYFFLMLLLLMGGQCLYEYIEKKIWKLPCLSVFLAVLGSVAEIWMLGAFRSEISVADVDYSVLYMYSSNLLTYFNPLDYSLFLKNLNQDWGEYEGYGYLGLGGMLLLFVSVCYMFFVLLKRSGDENKKKINTKFNICLTIFMIICFALAVGPRITFGSKLLFEIPMPAFTDYFFATFRSIGRFIWIDIYILFALFLYIVDRIGRLAKNRTVICSIFVLIVTVQVLDLTPAIRSKRASYVVEQRWDYKIKDKRWDDLADTHEYVYGIIAGRYPFPSDYTNSIVIYSYKNGLKLTSMYIAHSSNTMKEDSDRYLQEVIQNNANEDAIYWFENEDLMEQAKPYLHCEIIDDICVGWVE